MRRAATVTSPSPSTRCRWDRGSAGTWSIGLRANPPKRLLLRVARELKVRQPDAANQDLVGANGRRRLKARRAAGSHKIVLLHAVARYSQSTHHHAVPVERRRAREEYNARLIQIGCAIFVGFRLVALCAGICRIQIVQRVI